jgi:hypothetical protein
MYSNEAADAECSGALSSKGISLRKGTGYSMQADHSALLGPFLIGVRGGRMTVCRWTLRVRLRVKQSCRCQSST